jgi:hypothetical protein
MKGFVKDIEGLAVKNDEFRQLTMEAPPCASELVTPVRARRRCPPLGGQIPAEWAS